MLAGRIAGALVAVPILLGLALTLAPAREVAAWAGLWGWQGLWPSIRLTLGTGLASTALAYLITMLILASLWDRPLFTLIRRGLSPLLSLPHAAAALGIAMLIAPSGWIARALSPWATGWQAPPDLLILNDPMGLTLTLGLVAKEVPFLLLMSLAALPQTGHEARLRLAQSLGHGRVFAFWAVVEPALARRLSLPVLAVLSYGLTNVDMAMVLGPGLPPTLAVQITEWLTHPSGLQRAQAAAGAGLLLMLVALAFGLWATLHHGAGLLRGALAGAGHRLAGADPLARMLAGMAGMTILALLFGGVAVLGLWSLAGPFEFPAALPDHLTLTPWSRALPEVLPTAQRSLAIALAATALALLFCLPLLAQGGAGRTEALLFLPLILPQIAFLPGLGRAFLGLGPATGLTGVVLAHLLFVLPYAFLSLSGPARGLDPRFGLVAASLGAPPLRRLLRITLPMLLAPILVAAAVGMAVSIGQYLPTLLIGGGRVETLTTEALALSSGGSRRLTAALALSQALLPALGFALAIALPRLIYRRRLGMASLPGGAG